MFDAGQNLPQQVRVLDLSDFGHERQPRGGESKLPKRFSPAWLRHNQVAHTRSYRFLLFLCFMGTGGSRIIRGVSTRIIPVSRIAVRTMPGGETLTVLVFLGCRIAFRS